MVIAKYQNIIKINLNYSTTHLSNIESSYYSPLVFITFLYLALPVSLFLVSWFRFEIAIPGIISLLIISYLLFRATLWSLPSNSLLFFIAVILISYGWIFISGIGHFVFSNPDWLVRDAVLRDLIALPWPTLYQTDNGKIFILRTALGYYLPAAAIGKLVGINIAHIILSIWSSIGVTLTFLLISSCFSSYKKGLVAIIVFIVFSGLDLIGSLIMRDDITIITHLEWWARYFQYSSHTTQLFWVPNHALPSWLGVLLLLAYWNNPSLINCYPAIMCITALWSPFATIGLFPFYLGYLFTHRRDLIQCWPNLIGASLLALFFGLPIAYYSTFNVGKIPGTLSANKDYFWYLYFLFIALEFGIMALLLSLRFYNFMPFWIAITILVILPYFSYGPNNDLAMRASIPALVTLALAAAQILTTPARTRILRGTQIGIFLLVLIGTVTAIHEIARAVILPRWTPSTSNSVFQTSQGSAHYLASIESNSLLAYMLRQYTVNNQH